MSYEIDYTVVIRTLGTAGEKYKALLSSIANLVPQPKEVIVVLPEGYDKPVDRLGYETFYFSPKGMVTQRVYGIIKTKTKYALVCDDDIAFDKDFVQKLHAPIIEGKCSFSSGPLLSFLPPKGLKTFVSSLMGAASPTIFKSNRYISILRTGGYSFNRNIDTTKSKYYESQSLAWTCFFADVEALNALNISDEVWLDMNGYSAFDDQTMFYKGWLKGYKTLVVSDALYQHLDGKTSTKNNKPATMYSSIFNRYVFWHRFIYKQEKNPLLKFWSAICFKYRILWCRIFEFVDFLRHRSTKDDLSLFRKAYKDVKIYIKSNEYLQLPPI